MGGGINIVRRFCGSPGFSVLLARALLVVELLFVKRSFRVAVVVMLEEGGCFEMDK